MDETGLSLTITCLCRSLASTTSRGNAKPLGRSCEQTIALPEGVFPLIFSIAVSCCTLRTRKRSGYRSGLRTSFPDLWRHRMNEGIGISVGDPSRPACDGENGQSAPKMCQLADVLGSLVFYNLVYV